MPDRILTGASGTRFGFTSTFDMGAVRVSICSGCRCVVPVGEEDGHMTFHQILLDMADELDQRDNA